MLRTSIPLFRGYKAHEPWGGNNWRWSLKKIGGIPRLRPIFFHFNYIRPERPIRAVANKQSTALMLADRADQLALIENALQLRRAENQVELMLLQLNLSVRNADDFIDKHLLPEKKERSRPNVHVIFFHDQGLVNKPHILSNLATHHIVPLLSLVSYDVEKKAISLYEAEQIFNFASDVLVSHSVCAQREICNQFIRSCCLHGNTEKAIEVLYHMKRKSIRRTFVTYAPLFRLARTNDDLELQMQVDAILLQLEGGRLQKFLFIDLPRLVHVFWVAVRFNWYWLSACVMFGSGVVIGLILINLGLI